MRGLAVAAVVVFHGWPSALPGGFLGVEVFFVLSGFLVTSLLLRNGVDGFGAARVRRLLPAALAMAAGVTAAVALLARDAAAALAGDLIAALTGTMNWRLIAQQASYFAQTGRPSPLRHLWSLAVEVQFYALYGVAMGWLQRRGFPRRTGLVAVGLVAVLSTAAMAWSDPTWAYYATDARLAGPLSGAALAWWMAGRRPHAGPARLAQIDGAAVASILGLSLLVFAARDADRWLYPWGFVATRLASVALIVAVVHHGVVDRWLSWAPLAWLGRRSYALYLWHWPLVALFRPGIDTDLPAPLSHGLQVAAALALAEASHRLVEAPILARPGAIGSWTRRQPALATLVAACALVGSIGVVRAAQPPGVDPIAQSLEAGAAVVAAQVPPTVPVASTVAPVTDTVPVTTPPSTALAAAAATRRPTRPVTTGAPQTPRPTLPAGPPPGSVNVTAIGDSVMLGAAGALKARLGDASYLDAVKSRQFGQGVDAVRVARAQGRLARVVVVHLGTNGPATRPLLDQLLAELHGVEHVLLVNVRVPKSWEAGNNRLFAEAPSIDPRVVLVDWHGYSSGHRSWFYSDGIHLRAEGAARYAELIGSAVPPPPPPPTTTTTAPPTTTTLPPPSSTTLLPTPTTSTTQPTSTTTAPPPLVG